MISHITSMTNPDLLVMHYSSLQVVDLTVVPKILLYTYSNRKEKTVIANCQTCWMGRLQYFVR